MKQILIFILVDGKEGFISVDNEPVVILRPADIKVVLVSGNTRPLITEPPRTTSVIIKRSDIPGSQGPIGPPGPKGDAGELVIGGFPDIVDGGNF
jgi:hypothetical protein